MIRKEEFETVFKEDKLLFGKGDQGPKVDVYLGFGVSLVYVMRTETTFIDIGGKRTVATGVKTIGDITILAKLITGEDF